jgi:hypothetical protein
MRAIRVDTVIETSLTSDEFFALAADPERYVAIEPSLRSARWLTAVPIGAGSVAEVEPTVIFTVPAVRRLIGASRGIVTITEWDPPSSLTATYQATDLMIRARVEWIRREEGQVAVVRGELVPESRLTRTFLSPLYPLLEVLVARSLARAVRRIESSVGGH